MHSKTALWKKVATLQEKVEEMRGLGGIGSILGAMETWLSDKDTFG